jgi:hypothetical protein
MRYVTVLLARCTCHLAVPLPGAGAIATPSSPHAPRCVPLAAARAISPCLSASRTALPCSSCRLTLLVRFFSFSFFSADFFFCGQSPRSLTTTSSSPRTCTRRVAVLLARCTRCLAVPLPGAVAGARPLPGAVTGARPSSPHAPRCRAPRGCACHLIVPLGLTHCIAVLLVPAYPLLVLFFFLFFFFC